MITAVQDELWDMTGARTVPRIYLRSQKRWIGGWDDLLELSQSGRLLSLLHGFPSPVTGITPTIIQLRNQVDGMVTLSVQFTDVCGGCRRVSVDVPTTLTGLMLKSQIMAELSLDGGFGSWVMDTSVGSAFPSREPIADLLLAEGDAACNLILRARAPDEPKRVGRT